VLRLRFLALLILWCAVCWATWWVCRNRHGEMRPTELLENGATEDAGLGRGRAWRKGLARPAPGTRDSIRGVVKAA